MRAIGAYTWLWCALTFSSACTHAVSKTTLPTPPSAGLVSSERLAPAMVLRQHLSGHYGDKHFDIECVLQVSHGELTIVGLTPFGTRAFVLTQKGTEHTFTKMIDREVPFEPARILEDVHRVFFRGLPSPADGLVTGVQGNERVEEERVSGVLRERRFERLDHQPSGVVRVKFGGPNAPLVPEHIVLENGWYGYTLEIDNVEQQALPEETP